MAFGRRRLVPPDAALGDTFWAPEVAHDDGNFYLYYSVGREDKGHQLRVAVSNHPMGPYQDAGKALVDPADHCPSPLIRIRFRTMTGSGICSGRRTFWIRKTASRAGTALMADRMLDMTTLAGEAKTVLRARSDWQRFLKDRPMYDGRLRLAHAGRPARPQA